MQHMEMFFPKTFEDIDTVKARLRECKDEWLEKKPGQGNITYMSHNTMRQILDNAVRGITYWEFTVLEQWREEIFAFNKHTNSYYFDGYVYHVKGSMFIPGIGRREQYGSKPGIGGKSNQDSAYKAAASNCFTKCASLFGVGEEIYSKIKVEGEEEQVGVNQQFQQPNNFNNNLQQHQQQGWGGQQQMQQQQAQQPMQQQWNQGQQQWSQGQQQQQWNQNQFNNNNQWNQGNQQQQGAFQQSGNFNQGQQQLDQAEQPAVGQTQQNTLEQDMLEADRAVYNGQVEHVPFLNVQENSQQQATQQSYTATQQTEATPNNYNAESVQYGAPVSEPSIQAATQEGEKKQEPVQQTQATSPNNQGTNPWQEKGVIEELQKYAAHKKRLNIENDDLMIPYLRDHFKDENATTEFLTHENLKDFNAYLQNVSV